MDAFVQKCSTPGLRRIQNPRHRRGQIAQGEIMPVSFADETDGPDGRFAQQGPHTAIGRKQALREGLHVGHAVLGNRGGHPVTLSEGSGYRFLAEDVFAGLCRSHNQFAVPESFGTDRHCMDIRAS